MFRSIVPLYFAERTEIGCSQGRLAVQGSPSVRDQLTARIQKATGLRITIHQFRHAAAAIYLKHHPGDYETVRRLLGHRNVRTTVRFYCGLETIHASRLFGKVVRQHLRFSDDEPHRETD